jgi:hypothetical protein
MSSPLAKNLLRELTNWTPRTGTKKCQKCRHEYNRHTMFPLLFTNNIFLDSVDDDNNNDYNRYTYCRRRLVVGGCKCKGFIHDE